MTGLRSLSEGKSRPMKSLTRLHAGARMVLIGSLPDLSPMRVTPTIDRQARNQMATAIRSYMADEITAFQFDDALQKTMDRTRDGTVEYIGIWLWFHYDDRKDHKIHASKEEWDYFNRLLLLLESDAQIICDMGRRHWHWRQAIAATCLAAFMLLATGTGFGPHLLLVSIPFGAISMLLAWFAARGRDGTTSPLEIAITPFPSVASLLAVRRRVPGFTRARHPVAIGNRRIRSSTTSALLNLQWRLILLLFGPIVLFFQMFPERKSQIRITQALAFFLASAVAATLADAEALSVGDGQPFSRIDQALANAHAGDEIVVHPHQDAAPYRKVALQIRTPRLTIRSVDPGTFITLDGEGFGYSGSGPVSRAIVQFDPGADGCVLEGFELINARNDSFNGAGVRINQANDITIRRCRIQHNDMGIMSNGSLAAQTGARQLIEACLIADNGTDREPGQNHNLYLGGTSVTVRTCEIARSTTGHNLKSRAHFNWIEYNYIHDSSNRELDLVDAKDATDAPDSNTVLLGNFIVKKPSITGNKAVIHFGRDGKASHDGTLYLVHNTIVTPYISPVVDVSDGRGVVFTNNAIDDALAKQAGVLIHLKPPAATVTGAGNSLPDGFFGRLPQSVQAGPIVPWDRVQLPWPAGHRSELLEYLGIGKTQPRQAPLTAGAGQLPR